MVSINIEYATSVLSGIISTLYLLSVGRLVNNFISPKSTFDFLPNNAVNIPDWFMDKIIAPRTFKVAEISLDDLLRTDSSFKEYFDSGEERYDQEEVNHDELYQELVVVDGILLDGYNRASTLLRMGDNTAYAFVALPK